MSVRHFLDLDQLDGKTLREILDLAVALKAGRGQSGQPKPLAGGVLAAIFEKPSTRTRVSFEVAARELGGDAIVLNPADTQLGRGETVADTARVLSRYVSAIALRARRHATLTELAAHASVPVINGLTDRTHPCQLMADVLTFEEHRGPIKGRIVGWAGDGNNMATSWIHAAVRFGFELRLACPTELMPPKTVLDWGRDHGGRIVPTPDLDAAMKGVDCVVTDIWVSMNDAVEKKEVDLLTPYRVDDRVMALAKPDALFMHCLPAHRNEEVSASVIDGPQSVVWDEAENRLHVQKGILSWCLAQA